MNQYTHKITKSNQSVIILPRAGADINDYRRVFIPFTPAELSRRNDLRKGHIQTVYISSIKSLTA